MGPPRSGRSRCRPPDLVVLDLMLPGTGGLQVARRISAARELPMLMLTARGDEDDVLRGFEAGVGSRRLWGRWPAVSRVRRRRGLPDRPES